MKGKNFYTKSIKSKILGVFLFATLSIALSWALSHIAFNKVVIAIKEVSKPNEKIRIINNLSYTLTKIVQFQRWQILEKNNSNIKIQHPDNQSIIKSLDTLRNLCNDNQSHLRRIDSMEVIIKNYNSLLSNYLNLYAEFIDYKKLSEKYRSLSDYISVISSEIDSNVVTTETKTVTTTIIPDENKEEKKESKPSFFQRLFGRKKSDVQNESPQLPIARKIIKEELNVRIDTLSIANREKFAEEFERTVHTIDQYFRHKGAKLLRSELVLINYSNDYINQFRDLLRAFEEDEMDRVNKSNAMLIETVNESIDRLTLILILFVIVTSVLSFMIFIDISRSNQYRIRLQKAKEEAENLSMVKQRFLSNMSHEIRTPLQSIVGFSEQIMHQEKPNREAIEIIYRSSEHLLQIVNEVLDYSRIVSGKYTFEKHEFSLHQLLNEVADTMIFQALNKNIQFLFNNNIDPNNYYCGDPFRLKQILFNLIGNAIKFTNKGGVTLEVISVEQQNKTEFQFNVKDTGTGLSKEDLNRIFNEFEQAGSSENGKNSGTGLGLSITKSLVELQGGSITANSELGKGSIFSFTLSFDKIEREQAVTLYPQIERIGLYPGKVMVIDDDKFILKLCSDIFNKHNVPHCCYSSPEEVIQNWKDDVSLILMDIRMPEINGFKLCSLLRAKSKKELIIVALTAQALSEERSAILKQGFDELITKPFKEQDIMAILNSTTLKKGDKIESFENSYLVKMSMGDEKLLHDNLNTFIHETKQDVEILLSYIKKQNRTEIAEVMHKLAGRIAQVGAMSLSVKIRQIEAKLKQDNNYCVNMSDFENVINEIDALIDFIKRADG